MYAATFMNDIYGQTLNKICLPRAQPGWIYAS